MAVNIDPPQPEVENSETEPIFEGHDAGLPGDWHLANASLAGAHTLASAASSGSTKVKRGAILLIAFAFGLPMVLGLVAFISALT